MFALKIIRLKGFKKMVYNIFQPWELKTYMTPCDNKESKILPA